MKLNRKPDHEDEYEVYDQPPRRWRLSRQGRETVIMCLVAGLIAALVWGIYNWTNASRFVPPVYK